MRLALVNKFLAPRGGDTTAAHLARRWLEARGHQVFPFGTLPGTTSGPLPAGADGAGGGTGGDAWIDADLFPPPLPAQGPRIARLAAVYRPSAGRAFGALLDRRRPDVVHLHNIHYHLGGAVIAAARERRIPVAWTLHDLNLFCPNVCGFRAGGPCLECHAGRYHRCVSLNCRGSLAASAAAAAEAYLLRGLGLWRQVTRFVAPSRFTQLLLETHGVEAERIAHVEPGLDLETFAAPARGGAGLLYVGRLAPEKGIEVLLEALRALPAARLRLAGDGPLRAGLERRAEERAPGRVEFLGFLDRSGVAAALACADALVLPSLAMEVAPFALLEAAAAGVPVVASAVGGVPEWVADGETGWLTPPGDAAALAETLAAALARPRRAREAGARARQIARARFDPELHCGRLERLYADAVAA
jgi:glycosyltransferase involved in cell wall biosynthesis